MAFSCLRSDLDGMVNNPQLSDVQLQVDTGEVYFAHSFMLYARCPLLAEMVNNVTMFLKPFSNITNKLVTKSVTASCFLRTHDCVPPLPHRFMKMALVCKRKECLQPKGFWSLMYRVRQSLLCCNTSTQLTSSSHHHCAFMYWSLPPGKIAVTVLQELVFVSGCPSYG